MTATTGLGLPAQVRRATVTVPGGALAVLDVEAAGGRRGPTIVLVPGFSGSKEDFRLLLGPLSSAGHRVVALDQRGQYESPGPDDPTAYGVDALAADLLAALDALDDGPVHLVGHSFGGLVARAAVLDRPGAVRTLTLIGSGPAGLRGPRVDLLPALAVLLDSVGIEGVADVLDGLPDPRRDAQPAAVRAFLRARFVASSPTGLVAMADALTTEPDRVAELAATGVPVLVLHGEQDDAWTPALQGEMAVRLSARHVAVPDAQHSPAVENPAPTVAALLEFWAAAA